MKLQPMTDFVLERYEFWTKDDNPDCQSTARYISSTKKYAEFLKQPLTPGMFVPVDEAGNVLEEPEHFKEWHEAYKKCFIHEYEGLIMFKYLQAKEKVMFEGFQIENMGLGSMVIRKNGWVIMRCSKTIGAKWKNVTPYQTVEDLEYLDLELTPSALKTIRI